MGLRALLAFLLILLRFCDTFFAPEISPVEIENLGSSLAYAMTPYSSNFVSFYKF